MNFLAVLKKGHEVPHWDSTEAKYLQQQAEDQHLAPVPEGEKNPELQSLKALKAF